MPRGVFGERLAGDVQPFDGSCYQMCGTSGLSTMHTGAGVNVVGNAAIAPPGTGWVGSAGVVSHGGTMPGF